MILPLNHTPSLRRAAHFLTHQNLPYTSARSMGNYPWILTGLVLSSPASARYNWLNKSHLNDVIIILYRYKYMYTQP